VDNLTEEAEKPIGEGNLSPFVHQTLKISHSFVLFGVFWAG